MTEGTPAPEWEPGDPLHEHPHYRPSGDGNYVRELFQELCDEAGAVRVFLAEGSSPLWQVKCRECLVGWAPDEGRFCWACGMPAANYHQATSRAVQRLKEETSFLRGGPRDGQAVEAPTHAQEIVVPLPMARVAFHSEEPTASETCVVTGRYVRSYFNYTGWYWVHDYVGPALPDDAEECSSGTPGCSIKHIHEYCIYKEI